VIASGRLSISLHYVRFCDSILRYPLRKPRHILVPQYLEDQVHRLLLHLFRTLIHPRYCLNYKALPYRTEWIEYPDIKALCLKLGAPSNHFEDDGITPLYTLPVIYDPVSNSVISESFNIAVYLDTQYPDTPRVLPHGTRALQHAFAQQVSYRTAPNLRGFIDTAVLEKLPERSQEFYQSTRDVSAPRGEDAVTRWDAFQKGLSSINKHYTEAREEIGGDFLCENTPTFADFAVASALQWCYRGFGSESEQWKDIASWQEGKWAGFLQSLNKYAEVV